MYVIVNSDTRKPLRTSTTGKTSGKEQAIAIPKERYIELVNNPFLLSKYVVSEGVEGLQATLKARPTVSDEPFFMVPEITDAQVQFVVTANTVQFECKDEYIRNHGLRVSLLRRGNPLQPVAHNLRLMPGKPVGYGINSQARSLREESGGVKLYILKRFLGFTYGVAYQGKML